MKYQDLTPFTKSFIEVTSIIILVCLAIFGALMFIAGLVQAEMGMIGFGLLSLLIVAGVVKEIRK